MNGLGQRAFSSFVGTADQRQSAIKRDGQILVNTVVFDDDGTDVHRRIPECWLWAL
jgi:hypothetical protein